LPPGGNVIYSEPATKLRLYRRIREALKLGGTYIEGDYVVDPPEERRLLEEYRRRVAELEPEAGPVADGD